MPDWSVDPLSRIVNVPVASGTGAKLTRNTRARKARTAAAEASQSGGKPICGERASSFAEVINSVMVVHAFRARQNRLQFAQKLGVFGIAGKRNSTARNGNCRVSVSHHKLGNRRI